MPSKYFKKRGKCPPNTLKRGKCPPNTSKKGQMPSKCFKKAKLAPLNALLGNIPCPKIILDAPLRANGNLF
jgi:hypothetical protein